MKFIKYPLAVAGLIAFMTACSDNQTKLSEAGVSYDASNEELQAALADRDTLISIITEINNGVSQIKELENIITVSNGEIPNQRADMINDINAIKQAIAQRQARLAELEKKLSQSGIYSAQLQKDIASLRAQIESQQAEIAHLTEQLGIANETISSQAAQIDTLNTTVQNVSTELSESQENNARLTADLNTCYYAVGSSKNLKEKGILEKKFLRSEKVMTGSFDQSYFTKADKTTLKVIPLYAKKAEVKTNQPTDSYELRTDSHGQLELVITNPARFWQLTDYLVIETK